MNAALYKAMVAAEGAAWKSEERDVAIVLGAILDASSDGWLPELAMLVEMNRPPKMTEAEKAMPAGWIGRPILPEDMEGGAF